MIRRRLAELAEEEKKGKQKIIVYITEASNVSSGSRILPDSDPEFRIPQGRPPVVVKFKINKMLISV